MKQIYLAGPIFETTDPTSWRVEVVKHLPSDWQDVNPLDLEHYVPGKDPKRIVDKDLAAIEECDAVLALVDDPSWGTAMEIFFANSMGIPVIGWRPKNHNQPASPWLLAHCDAITDSLKEVMEYLRAQG